MSCEIQLVFTKNDEKLTLNDKDLIKSIPYFVKALEKEDSDWESKDFVLSSPIPLEFRSDTGIFIFLYLEKYTESGIQNRNENSFEEAEQWSLDSLREVIALAALLECNEFMDAIGFVIARKLESLPVEEIVKYLGVDSASEESAKEHPPAKIRKID